MRAVQGWPRISASSAFRPKQALAGAEVAILAVPDTHIGKVAQSIQHLLKPGTMVVVLDAAAPFAGHLPERPDLTYFVTHPCHPPIFNDETDMERSSTASAASRRSSTSSAP